MATAAGILIFIGWIWSIINGFGVGLPCAILCFLFPPLAQFIFCIYEPKIRMPTLIMIIGLAIGAWQGIHAAVNASSPTVPSTQTRT
jgi:hypothetical protein